MTSIILRTLSCVVLCSVLFVGRAVAQTCPGGLPYLHSYEDTIVNGQGYNEYLLPQFDPTLGTLYSVDIEAAITFIYSYTLTNISGVNSTYNVRLVSRTDDIEAYSTYVPDVQNIFHEDTAGTAPSPPLATHSLANNQSVSNSVTIYNNRVFHTTATNNVVTFLGDDTLKLRYLTATFGQAAGPGNKNFTETSSETIALNITYNYCPAVTLPSTFIKLTASKQSSNILLAWTSQQILTGGSFELLKSIDGRTYTSINKQVANSNSLAGYNYLYKPTAQDPSKAFFRIKQTDQNGNVTYSKVITVILPTKDSSGSIEETKEKDLVVYPTVPTNFINVFIPSGTNTDEWTISIISLAGRVMQQTKFSKTNLAKVQFINPLAPGMYIVDAYNSRTQEHFKDKIVVQR